MAASDVEVVALLSRSRIFRDYERAFALATELPLTLHPARSWSLVQRGRRNGNPFCALLSHSRKVCAECLKEEEKIRNANAHRARSHVCFAGLCHTAVPIQAGERVIGFLQTGQVALDSVNEVRFAKITRQLLDWGAQVDLRRLEDAYFHCRVLRPRQYAGMVQLLEIFAMHLGELGNQLLIRGSAGESPFAMRAKAYVNEHLADSITLFEISRALHVSTFYFCKLFKKATGLTFTDYLGRVRVERAKVLLLDPNRRVGEIAYDVGFGSLTHFNRVFRRVTGCAPSSFRMRSCRL